MLGAPGLHDSEKIDFAGVDCLMPDCEICLIIHRILNCVLKKYNRGLQRLRLSLRHQQCSVPHAKSAALPIKPVSAAVALAVVLGSRTAEMSVIHGLTTRGRRASRLAEVSCGDWHSHGTRFGIIELDRLAKNYARHPNRMCIATTGRVLLSGAPCDILTTESQQTHQQR